MTTAAATSVNGLPPRRVLRDDQIAAVHRASIKTLEEVGILIEHRTARSLLVEAGAIADHPDSHLVKIPGPLIDRVLSTVPPEFRITGQHPSRDFTIGHDTPPRARPVMSLDWIIDYGAKQRRQATTIDLEAWVRVADSLPNLSMVTGLYPWDAPPVSRDLRAAEAMLRLSGKPILIAPFSGWAVERIAEMLSVLPDRRGPKAIVFSSCNSPLIYSESQMGVLLAAVQHDLPVMINSSAVTGATAPVTLAGTLVIMNAEILAGLAVAQLAKPGASVIYAGHPIVLDMRTSIASCGHAEGGLLAAALVDLGRSYRVPTTSNGLTTDSTVCDEQAAIEKMITAYDALLAGAALNGGAGSLASLSTVSLEQLIIDDDIYGGMFRMREGISMDTDTLAFDTIAAVGPNRHFLEDAHTLRYMRREFRQSKLANRQNPDVWLQQGGRDIVEVAAGRARTILKNPPPPRLEPAVLAGLAGIVTRAEQEGNG